MKKFIPKILLVLALGLSSLVYGAQENLFDMRKKIFEEAKEIRSSLSGTKDTILLNTMWDSCIMAMSQIDAYFYMMRIFNTVEQKDLKKEAVDSLIYWLNEIKRTNESNIKNLAALKVISGASMAPRTRIHMNTLEGYFGDVNNLIDTELEKFVPLKVLLEKRQGFSTLKKD